ncbi:MAG: hypothetical protein ACK5LS_02730 [Propioniciclava sp.]
MPDAEADDALADPRWLIDPETASGAPGAPVRNPNVPDGCCPDRVAIPGLSAVSAD